MKKKSKIKHEIQTQTRSWVEKWSRIEKNPTIKMLKRRKNRGEGGSEWKKLKSFKLIKAKLFCTPSMKFF